MAIEPEEEIVLFSPYPPANHFVGCFAIASAVGNAPAGKVYAVQHQDL